MKKRMKYGSFMIASLVVLLYLTSPLSAETTENSNMEKDALLDTIGNTELEEYEQPFASIVSQHTDWFPGFLIVQLIKGILAFIVVLLILFDIIEP